MREMARIPRYAKMAAAREVRSSLDRGGTATAVVERIAAQFGVSQRTVWRWARRPPDTSTRPAKVLTRDELIVIASYQGNRHAAWRELCDGGLAISYRQFVRRLGNTDTDMVAAATEGVKAALQAGLYNRQADSYSRGDVFGFDHTEIPVFTWTPGDEKPKKLWVSVIVDWATSFIFRPVFIEGEGVKGDPNTRSIIALVASVLVGQEFDGELVGGIPGLIVFDNALAHLSDAVQEGYVAVPVRTHAIRRGSPWENGATENAIGVIEKLVWKPMPGYSHHLSTRYGHFPWKLEELFSPEELIVRTVAGIEEMNRSRRLERHGGQSPLAAWKADPALVEMADRDLVRHQFLESAKSSYKVQKTGVTFRGMWYQDKALAGHVGHTVSIRHLPHDRSFIDIYLAGEFLCSAGVTEGRTLAQRSELARMRRNRIARADAFVKAGASRRVVQAFQKKETDEFSRRGEEARPIDEALADYLSMGEA